MKGNWAIEHYDNIFLKAHSTKKNGNNTLLNYILMVYGLTIRHLK